MNGDDAVCLQCVGDTELRRILREQAVRGTCASCGHRRMAIPLHLLADEIDRAYRENYAPGGDVSDFSSDSDNVEYAQEGEDPSSIVQELAGIEHDISGSGHFVSSRERVAGCSDGSDAYYDIGSSYVERDIHPTGLHLDWESFCRRLKHKRRFFDDEGRSILADVLGNSESIRDPANPLSACVDSLRLGTSFFRARRAENLLDAFRIADRPRQHLGPPPAKLAQPGRMNPAGISVFYGGLSENVCIAEVRVSGLVTVAAFHTTRRLRLLNLTRLDEAGFAPSMFSSNYFDRVTKRMSLRSFHYLVSRPIQPSEEALEYLPTQAAAEYISTVLGLDGLIYESAQLGVAAEDDDGIAPQRDRSVRNVALFHQASLVHGSVPRRKTQELLLDGSEPISAFWAPIESSDDERRPSLRFVKGSVKVFRVTSIAVSHREEEVGPYRPFAARPHRKF